MIRERVGRDGLQRGDARWGDPTRPSEKNGTFLHLSRETKLLEVSVIFEDNVRNISTPQLPAVPLSLLVRGDAQAEDKCVPDPGQLCFPTV